MSDLVLAIAHHLTVFGLAAVLAAELALMRPAAVSAGTLRLLGRCDAAYGLLSLTILALGFLRVWYGAKGADFYLHNPMFWAKIAAFGAVGLLSIRPTMRIAAWQKALKADAAFLPQRDEIGGLRRFLLAEAAVFALIPVFAAAMARGIGFS
jgi:putative membrane protein